MPSRHNLCASLFARAFCLAALPAWGLAQATWTQVATFPCPPSSWDADAHDLFGIGIVQVDRALWRTDGTAAGTYLLINLTVPRWLAEPAVRMGDRLFFSNRDAATGEELWASDGTAAGTARIRDYLPGVTSLEPRGLTAARGYVVFRGQTPPSGGIEPYVSDGTFAGTRLLADIAPGAAGSNPSGFTLFDDRVVFFASDGTHGRELWSTDGTTAGTAMIVDYAPGPADFGAELLGKDDERLYLRLGLYSNTKLLISDGTAAGTTQLYAWSRSLRYPSPLQGFVHAGGRRWFTVELYNVAGSSFELWSTDGTTVGTISHGEIWPAVSRLAAVPQLWSLGSRLMFEKESAAAGREPWIIDPATGAQWLAGDFARGSTSSQVTDVYPLSSGPVVLGVRNRSQRSVWAVDPAGGVPSSLLRADTGAMTAVGDRVWFTGQDGTQGYEFWRTDGTAVGTVRVGGETYAGAAGAFVHDMVLTGGRLVALASERFSSNSHRCGPGIWSVDAGAHAQKLGDPGASGPGLATMSGTDPVLGSTLDLRMEDLDPAALFAVVMDAPSSRPRWLGSFWAYAALTSPETVAVGALTGGAGSLSLAVPADPALTGLQVVVQGFGLGAPELRATNGVLLVLGN